MRSSTAACLERIKIERSSSNWVGCREVRAAAREKGLHVGFTLDEDRYVVFTGSGDIVAESPSPMEVIDAVESFRRTP